MNEDDLKKVKVKKVKVIKTAESEAVELKPAKRTQKKAEPKVESVAKTVKAKKTTAAKIDDVSVEKAVVETKPKRSRAKAKNGDLVIAENTVEAKAETKPKKSKTVAKAKEPVEAKSSTKTPRAKKTTAKKLPQESEIKPDSLPLAAKIQTQENYDLTENKTEAEELSPVFKELAEPKLPTLREENRAFLQIQSPTRVFFYWSLKQTSYNTLQRALGNRANDYFLAIRLKNLNTGKEEIHQVGNKGSWWFNNIEADSRYQAEVGFYTQGRPFVRIVFSNILETPRQRPSDNVAYQPYFAVTANQFAEVLDLAGFSQDAFDVYVAGDEPQFPDEATQKAFVQLAGKGQVDFSGINLNELRHILFALASGISLYSLRGQVSASLFEFLAALTEQNPDALTEEKVILTLEEFFGASPFEEGIEEEFGEPVVFGASLVNFPKQLRKKKSGFNPDRKISPLSSFSLK